MLKKQRKQRFDKAAAAAKAIMKADKEAAAAVVFNSRELLALARRLPEANCLLMEDRAYRILNLEEQTTKLRKEMSNDIRRNWTTDQIFVALGIREHTDAL